MQKNLNEKYFLEQSLMLHFFNAFFMANPNFLSKFIKNLGIKKYSWFHDFGF
jgi:hypothetical protein